PPPYRRTTGGPRSLKLPEPAASGGMKFEGRESMGLPSQGHSCFRGHPDQERVDAASPGRESMARARPCGRRRRRQGSNLLGRPPVLCRSRRGRGRKRKEKVGGFLTGAPDHG